MKITKIVIKNLFGISEHEADGKSVEPANRQSLMLSNMPLPTVLTANTSSKTARMRGKSLLRQTPDYLLTARRE